MPDKQQLLLLLNGTPVDKVSQYSYLGIALMLTADEIIHNYIDIQNQSYNKTIQTNNIPIIKNNLQKIRYQISNNLKRHQLGLICSNKTLRFYSNLII